MLMRRCFRWDETHPRVSVCEGKAMILTRTDLLCECGGSEMRTCGRTAKRRRHGGVLLVTDERAAREQATCRRVELGTEV